MFQFHAHPTPARLLRSLLRVGRVFLLAAFSIGALPQGWGLSDLAHGYQDRFVTSPGMPGHTNVVSLAGIELDWGLAVDLRSPILLEGPGRGGSIDAGLRALDLGVSAKFNRDLWGFAVLEGTEEDLALRQAALVYEGLSGSSYLRLGVLPIDFGKQMQARPYDLPYPERPGVLRAYLGDQVTATGVSYGDVFATSDRSTLRTSIGIFAATERLESNIDGRAQSLPGLEVSDGLRADELGLNARVTGLFDVGPEGVFQWGLSAHSVPDFTVAFQAGDGTSLSAEHLEHWVYGMDWTFGLSDETEGPSWSIGWEGLIADGQIGARAIGAGPATLEVFDDRVFGQYLWLEHQTRSGRALGTVISSFEQPEIDKPMDREYSLYFSRPLGKNSQLRFQVSHRDVEGEPSSDRLVVQWIGLAGQLGHALNW